MGAQKTVNPCTYLTQSHVGSLCRQAREEELAGKLRDMEVLRQGGALPPGGGTATGGAAAGAYCTAQAAARAAGSSSVPRVLQAQARLQEHGQYIDGKLLALSKYCARLDAALAWAADLAQRRAAGAPAADIAVSMQRVYIHTLPGPD